MSDDAPRIQVDVVDYATALAELRAVRETVFVQEQGVPVDLEIDPLDPLCHHVLARDDNGHPIGTGRLTPERRIGRMAVLAAHRGKGVGDALLQALLEQARAHRWPSVSLHAQAEAIPFYIRHGFLPRGPRFEEAGIVHQDMHRSLGVPTPVEGFDAARAALQGLAMRTRRELCLHTRELDPGLLDRPELIESIRRLIQDGGELRVLLRDPKAAQDAQAPLIGLGQRRASAIAFRVIEEPVDLNFPGAYAFNDRGGWYYRPLGHRVDGESRIDDPARVRQLRAAFQEVWERGRPCSEFRALGL